MTDLIKNKWIIFFPLDQVSITLKDYLAMILQALSSTFHSRVTAKPSSAISNATTQSI